MVGIGKSTKIIRLNFQTVMFPFLFCGGRVARGEELKRTNKGRKSTK